MDDDFVRHVQGTDRFNDLRIDIEEMLDFNPVDLRPPEQRAQRGELGRNSKMKIRTIDSLGRQFTMFRIPGRAGFEQQRNQALGANLTLALSHESGHSAIQRER